jgi:hypothetical protein
MGIVMGQYWHLGLLAEAYGKVGQVDEGLVRLEEGLALMQHVGYSQYEPEFHRLRGELLRLKAEPEADVKAEQCFRLAIEIARRQEARWWELRSTTSLARLWQDQGSANLGQALQMLVGIYDWFGQISDVPHLLQARNLLKKLAAEGE